MMMNYKPIKYGACGTRGIVLPVPDSHGSSIALAMSYECRSCRQLSITSGYRVFMWHRLINVEAKLAHLSTLVIGGGSNLSIDKVIDPRSVMLKLSA